MIANALISQTKLMPASGRGNSLELALEVSELRYRRLFETAQDGILILDADNGKIIDVSITIAIFSPEPVTVLIKAHGGTLEAESEGSSQGAKFTARFKIDDSLCDFTTQGPLPLESNQPSGAKMVVAASANSTNPEL